LGLIRRAGFDVILIEGDIANPVIRFDIPELDESFFKKETVPWPPAKKQLTIRLDEDILAWLKSQGPRYQTRINAILRSYYEAHKHDRHT
jgi:uncharacterized protein (DUF4415 family)